MTDTRIPFTDLSWQWRQIATEATPRLLDLFERSAFILGASVAEFEAEFAACCDSRFAIGVNSGTSALHLAVLAAGVQAGDEVLVPSHTFAATAWAVSYVGAVPVFCDVDAATGTLDVVDAERRVTSRTRAIIPVHLYGQPADLNTVVTLAEKRGLTIIEDCAQSHLARYGGRSVGAFGRFGCFSFYPGKNLGAAGEAGIVVTNDEAAVERIRALRNHAQSVRYRHDEVGFNYRMEGIQGLVLGEKLKHLAAWTDQRRVIARAYDAGLADLPLDLPAVVSGDHVYHLYVVRHERRAELAAHLGGVGIDTGLHYPIPLHRQPCYADLAAGHPPLPIADDWADRCLSLPIFPGMTEAQVDRVVSAVRSFFGAAS